MISRILAICVLAVSVSCTNSSLVVSAASAKWPAWIDEDKIRGACDFLWVDNRDHFAKLAAHGINTMLLSCAGLDVDTPEEIALLDKQADWCAELGLHLITPIQLCGSERQLRYLEPGGRCYVDGGGVALTKTPCPVDPDFWYQAVTRRAELIARHSLDHQIDGFILDPEMYGADDANFPGYCYCEYCFREFVQHQGLAVAEIPPPAERVSWLQQQGLQEAYEAWKQQQAEGLARGTEQAIHRINPDFVIGVYMLDGNNWYYNAWARGFGTIEMPAIAFSENTYSTGATSYIPRVREHFEQIGAHAVMCPGMWLQQFAAEDIAGQLFYMAQDSSGYWVFTTLGLARPEYGGHYGLPLPHDRYWNALRLASDELDRQAREGDQFAPMLELVHRQDTPRAALTEAGLLGPLQVDLTPLVAAGQTARPATVLRYGAVYYLLASAGETITGQLRGSPAGDQEQVPVYALIAADGEVLAEGVLPLGQVVSLNVVAPDTGLYKLALTTRAHLFSVVLNMPHVVLSVTEGVSVVQQATRMYFYVPPQVEQFRLTVRTPYVAEQARLVVWNPEGQEVANVQTFEKVAAEAMVSPTPEQRGKVWSFQIMPADHGTFYSANLIWDPQLPPYLAESPEALLVPVE